jgi:hypothetical protein
MLCVSVSLVSLRRPVPLCQCLWSLVIVGGASETSLSLRSRESRGMAVSTRLVCMRHMCRCCMYVHAVSLVHRYSYNGTCVDAVCPCCICIRHMCPCSIRTSIVHASCTRWMHKHACVDAANMQRLSLIAPSFAFCSPPRRSCKCLQFCTHTHTRVQRQH